MKNNLTTFTYGALLIVSILMIAVLLIISGTAMAAPANSREWLLDYEQVEAYPAPSVEPTHVLPYPAPVIEPTVTKKVKTKPKATETEKSKATPIPVKLTYNGYICMFESTNAWSRELYLDQAFSFMDNLGTKLYCFGSPPIMEATNE